MGSCPTDSLAYGPTSKCSSLVAFHEWIFFVHTDLSAWLELVSVSLPWEADSGTDQ